jgi:hypothetical protein
MHFNTVQGSEAIGSFRPMQSVRLVPIEGEVGYNQNVLVAVLRDLNSFAFNLVSEAKNPTMQLNDLVKSYDGIMMDMQRIMKLDLDKVTALKVYYKPGFLTEGFHNVKRIQDKTGFYVEIRVPLKEIDDILDYMKAQNKASSVELAEDVSENLAFITAVLGYAEMIVAEPVQR